MAEIRLKAIGTYGYGTLHLLDGAVRIVTWFHTITIPLDHIASFEFEPATGLRTGYIRFTLAESEGDTGTLDRRRPTNTVRFVRRHQKEFEAVRDVLSEHIELQVAPEVAVEADSEAQPAARVEPEATAPPPELQPPPQKVAAPRPLPDEKLIPRLAEAGDTALGMVKNNVQREDTLIGEMVARMKEESARVAEWSEDVARTSDRSGAARDLPGAEYLLGAARGRASRGTGYVNEVAETLGSRVRRRLSLSINAYEKLEAAARDELSASALLTVLGKYLGVDRRGFTVESGNGTGMYLSMVETLPELAERVRSISEDPAPQSLQSFETLYPQVTSSLQALNSAVELREQGLKRVEARDKIPGAGYLLHCARLCWQDALDSLGTSVQDFVRARQRSSPPARTVVDTVVAATVDLLCGQALLCVFDSYGSLYAPGVPEPSSSLQTVVLSRSTVKAAPEAASVPPCTTCGSPLRLGAKFCTSCGTPIRS